MRRLSTAVVASAVAVIAVAGCSAGAETGSVSENEAASEGSSRLLAALSRMAPIEDAPLQIYYGDGLTLTEMLPDGEPITEPPGYGMLVGFGAASLAGIGIENTDLGIDLDGAGYAITVGQPPQQYSLISGGQDTETLTSTLADQGWVEENGEFVSPSDFDTVDSDYARYTLPLARVTVSGSDVVFGSADADLSMVDGSESLADDERVSTVAQCLGDVVTAVLETVELSETTPLVGLGVRTPEGSQQRPQVVVCVSWDDAEEASAYAERATVDLTDGTSTAGRPYSDLFDPAEAVVDGAVASWETETDMAMTIFTAWNQGDIPGMVRTCAGLPPQRYAEVEDRC